MDRSLDLLIVLHVNELPIIAYRCSMLMYADDTVLVYSGKPADPTKKSLNGRSLIMIISIFITTPILLIAVLTVSEWATL